MDQSNNDRRDDPTEVRHLAGRTGSLEPEGPSGAEIMERTLDPTEVIELNFPASPDLLVLARLVTGAVASRIGFDVEELDDLKLAVDELCLSSVGHAARGTLHLRFAAGDDDIQISCTFEPTLEPLDLTATPDGHPAASEGSPAVAGGQNGHDAELSERILEALVDEYGHNGHGTGATAWLSKRRLNGDPRRGPQ